MKASKIILASIAFTVAGAATAGTKAESAAMCWGVHVVTAAVQNDSRQPQEANINLQKATTIYDRFKNDASFISMRDKIILFTQNDPQQSASLLAKSAKATCGGAGLSLPYGIPGEPLSKATL